VQCVSRDVKSDLALGTFIAKREEQIVALRLRRVPFGAIARTVGVSKVSAIRAFYKALRPNTDQDIQSHHRTELADLEIEQTKVWNMIDADAKNPKVVYASMDRWKAVVVLPISLNRVPVRRARLLGAQRWFGRFPVYRAILIARTAFEAGVA